MSQLSVNQMEINNNATVGISNSTQASITSRMLFGKIHYAWIIAFASVLITGAGVGILNSCFGVFVRPVTESLGFSRGEFTVYGSISILVSVVLMPFYGTLFKRFGFRRIAIVSAIICGLAFIGNSMASQLWQFYIFALLIGLFINGFGIMSIGILINKWFSDAKGLALGIAFSGSGLLAAILIPLSNRFIELHGWRWTFQFLGAVSLFVLVPVIWFIVKDKPEDIGLEPYRSSKNQEKDAQSSNNLNAGLTREQAFRTPSFWLLIAAVTGIALSQAGPHVHTVAFLSDIGYSTAFVSIITSAYMLLLTGSKVIIGLLFDRLGSLKGSVLIGGSCVLFPILALFASFPVVPWFYALFLSLASSGSTILGTVLTINYFGRKDFPRIYSIVSVFIYIGVAVSSPVLGVIHDVTGGYSFAWLLIIGMGIAVCISLLGAYRMSKKVILTDKGTVFYDDSLIDAQNKFANMLMFWGRLGKKTEEGKDKTMKRNRISNEMHAHVKASDPVSQVINHPAFQGFGQYVLHAENVINDGDLPLNNINSLSPFHKNLNTDTTVNSINYMIDEVNEGKTIFYDIYSDEQKQEDSGKKYTGLFYFRGEPDAPFAVVCAGGAFKYVCSIHEGFPYAIELSQKGYNAFVLQYRVGGEQIASEDLAAAISFIFKHAQELEVCTKDYSIWGSSAGARMAANIGSYGPVAYKGDDLPRPGTIVMAYTGHTDYTKNDPPTFVVIGEEDEIVNPKTMEHRVNTLKNLGIDTEFHLYKNVGHGFGLGIGTSAEGWFEDAVRFWEKQNACQGVNV